MDMISFAILNGLSAGMAIFLVAAGVTLIFGILKVLNFAHGGFLMVGAYVAFTLTGSYPSSIWVLLGAALAGGVVAAGMGWVTDLVILRRLRGADMHYVLISTFGLMILLVGVVKVIWGLDYHSVSPPPLLEGTLIWGPVMLPYLSVFTICVGVATFLVLDFVIQRTSVGKLLLGLVRDPWMVSIMGYNVPVIYTLTVIAACFLAGLAGGLLLPNQALSPALGDTYIILGFITVILGGLGSVRGAFIAAMILGVADSVSVVVLNVYPGIAIYVCLVLTLLIRPQGLFGPTEFSQAQVGWLVDARFSKARRTLEALRNRGGAVIARADRLIDPREWPRLDLRLTDRIPPKILLPFGIGLALALLAVPYLVTPTLVFIIGVAILQGLFAMSWHFLFKNVGVISFGHAAFFATGAYLTGYILKMGIAVPFLVALVLAALVGAVIAGVIGLIALKRSSGIFFAILTLGLGEMCYIIVSSTEALGADDGMAGIPRPVMSLGITELSLAGDNAYYWFICAISALVIFGLWWLSNNRFGRVLRSIHQDSERAIFLGVDTDRYRLVAFMISGAVAALSGALYGPWMQIVVPDTAHLIHSTDAVLNSLLGGLGSFWGPMVGSAAFAAIHFFTRTLTGISEIVIGGTLLTVVLVAPFGLIGLAGGMYRRVTRLISGRVSAGQANPSERGAP